MTVSFQFLHPMRIPRGSRLALERFIDERAKTHGYTLAILRASDRRRQIVSARQDCMVAAYATGQWSYHTIGAAMWRDHSTVVHAVQKARRALAEQEAA